MVVFYNRFQKLVDNKKNHQSCVFPIFFFLLLLPFFLYCLPLFLLCSPLFLPLLSPLSIMLSPISSLPVTARSVQLRRCDERSHRQGDCHPFFPLSCHPFLCDGCHRKIRGLPTIKGMSSPSGLSFFCHPFFRNNRS